MSSSASETAIGGEVMASVDVVGGTPRLIIADITSDGSWLSVSEDAAAPVLEWR